MGKLMMSGSRSGVKHPFRLVLLITAIVNLSAYLVGGGFPHEETFVAVALQAVLLVLAYWHPTVALPVLLVISAAFDALMIDFRGFSLYGVVVAAGLLAYETTDAVAVALVIVLTLMQLIDTLIPGYDLQLRNVPSFVIIYMLSVLAGRGLRWRERRFEKERQAAAVQAQAERMQRNVEIADRIHDAVTGDLALAAAMTQQEMSQPDCANRELLTQVNDRIQSALANVHKVIDQLDSTDDRNNAVTVAQQQLMDGVRHAIHDGDERMASAGFQGGGTISVIGHPNDMPEHTLRVVQGLLREIYANLAKHAVPESPYELFVLLRETSIEITQVNRTRNGDEAPVFAEGGHGLAFYRESIRKLGGTLTAEMLDGDWNMYARIPLTQSR